MLKSAPRLSVQHKYDQSGLIDVLTLSSDRDEAIRYVNFEAIYIRIRHGIASRRAIPAVTKEIKADCPIYVYDGATNNTKRLYDVVRDTPTNSENIARVHYGTGTNSAMFSRDYVLREDPATQIVTWEPREVRLTSSVEVP